jgi:cyclopropane-fatty-acyl-phospholipid synthase
MTTVEAQIRGLLKSADVRVGGSRPQDIVVHDDRLYARLIRHRELGLGEAYMDGWWDSNHVDQTIVQLLKQDIRAQVKVGPAVVLAAVAPTLRNEQTVSRAKRNAEHHYNIGNDLYERMLDQRMIYSCGYWQGAKTLDEAQEQKLDLICRKLGLKKGMTLLDIGCGWGGFAEYAASKYGVKVTGISPAAEQVKLARARTKGLAVTIQQKDYREVKGTYDRIISVGMLEHVGPKNYDEFFAVCERLLAKDGMMLHHTIGGNKTDKYGDPWISKYIFPGAKLPTLTQLTKAVEGRFIIEDVHNFGPDYDKTLMAWHKNFVKRYPEIQDHYDERFYRMWTYYLLICAAAFRVRDLQLWQIVMTRVGESPTYIASR